MRLKLNCGWLDDDVYGRPMLLVPHLVGELSEPPFANGLSYAANDTLADGRTAREAVERETAEASVLYQPDYTPKSRDLIRRFLAGR